MKAKKYQITKASFLMFALLLFTSCFEQKSNENSLLTTEEKDSISDAIDYRASFIHYEVLEDSVMYHNVFRSGINLYLTAEAVVFKVKGADPNTFKEMIKQYAKDTLHMYHNGKKLKRKYGRRDPETFRVLTKSVTADKLGVYLNNEIIKNSHGPSFKFFNDSRYAKDNNQIYQFHHNFYDILKDVDKETFTVIETDIYQDKFTKDKNHIYFENTVIENLSANNFEMLGRGFSKDDKHIFYENTQIKKADYESFRVLDHESRMKYFKEEYYAEDKNNFYSTSYAGGNLLKITKKK